MKKNSKKSVIALVVAAALASALMLAAVIAAGIFGYSYISRVLLQNEEGTDYGFDEILEILSARYIGAYDEDELIVAAKRAVIDSLDDNWSYYMTADEYAQYLESSDNTYQGIGVEVFINEDAGGIEVTNVYGSSGAFTAGIVVGDIITAVDGNSLRGLTLNEVRGLLRRPIDDTALLTVLRTNGEYQDLQVSYSVIFTDPVSYEMLEGNIGYVKLRNFEGESADSFISAVKSLIEQGAAAFIYDVRSNNGGKVTEMTKMLDFLLPEGEIFIAVNTLGSEQVTKSDAGFIDLPAVVLVNAHSYSGAEYFTVTLSEFGYAATVGEQTTGKNRMQTTIPLDDGGAVHISTGMFLTPGRIDLFEQGGYTPDYPVAFTDEQLQQYYSGELSKQDDPQLQKAIELLQIKEQ